ncbi:AEC family transporter [Streptomyces sp. SID8014]|uniref:AEC family transporter n=1 Tax=Streptomyces sp. SID8014 TaxID=2706097 RepID=UPI0013BA2456|nr:AEC family transporter [Streptomyces sp. SID8014]
MTGVLEGFAVIGALIAVGYLVGRTHVLGEQGGPVLTRLAFHVASPALLFTTLAQADLGALTSPALLVTAASTLLVAGVYIVVGALRHWGTGPTTIGALCAGYVNAGNLGIPIAVYVLGDATLIAPVLLFQLLIVSPLALTVIDLCRPGARTSPLAVVTAPLRNPVVLGSLAGVAVAAAGIRVPAPVLDPVELMGAMAVPAVLLAFGISLRGATLPARGPERGQVLLAVGLKTAGQPVAAWAVGAGVFGLAGPALLAVVVTSALPAAQNLFTYASRYDTGVRLAREAVLLSTVLAVPALVAVAVLLG